MGLALDIGFGGFPLGIEGVEFLLETVLGGFARVDGAAQTATIRWHGCPCPEVLGKGAPPPPSRRTGAIPSGACDRRAQLREAITGLPFQTNPSATTVTRAFLPSHSRIRMRAGPPRTGMPFPFRRDRARGQQLVELPRAVVFRNPPKRAPGVRARRQGHELPPENSERDSSPIGPANPSELGPGESARSANSPSGSSRCTMAPASTARLVLATPDRRCGMP